jgi:hypothetical protein
MVKKRVLHTAEYEEGSTLGEDLTLRDECKSDEIKFKLQLVASRQHPLCNFSEEVKVRGIKNFDLNQFVLEALSTLDSSWWQEQLESLTPLEYKITAALADPEMREKLKQLLGETRVSETYQG